jgi:hypothetical protein
MLLYKEEKRPLVDPGARAARRGCLGFAGRGAFNKRQAARRAGNVAKYCFQDIQVVVREELQQHEIATRPANVVKQANGNIAVSDALSAGARGEMAERGAQLIDMDLESFINIVSAALLNPLELLLGHTSLDRCFLVNLDSLERERQRTGLARRQNAKALRVAPTVRTNQHFKADDRRKQHLVPSCAGRVDRLEPNVTLSFCEQYEPRRQIWHRQHAGMLPNSG